MADQRGALFLWVGLASMMLIWRLRGLSFSKLTAQKLAAKGGSKAERVQLG